MTRWWRFTAIGVLATAMMLALGASPGLTQPRAHVYLLRGLMNIFSLGMDTLAAELTRRGVQATVDNHADWQSLANQAAAKYKAGTEGPIILIGHSLGADAVMEMADYLGEKSVPVALVVPFDGTQSFSASANVARVLNLTQRDYAYMRRGPGFHGSLLNVDLSSDRNIDHLNIDKSPRLHARVINEVLAIVGGHRAAAPSGSALTGVSAHTPSGTEGGTKAGPAGDDAVRPDATPAAPTVPATPTKTGDKSGDKSGDGAMSAMAMKPVADNGTPIIALPERTGARANTDASAPHKAAATTQP